MLPEFVASVFGLAAAGFAGGWLKTKARFAAAVREHADLAHSARVTELEKHLLELLARGMPLVQLLDNVTVAIEAMAPQCFCTVLLLDEEEHRFLLSFSGPSLPPEYLQALSGLEIGPDIGACGSAAFRNETMIVEDVATDYRFAVAKDFVMSFGLRSCWSVPIRNVQGVVQGTFAMYHRGPRRPQPGELRLVEAGARLAGNVVERMRSEQRLREIAERFDLAEKAAEFGIWEVNIPTGVVTVSRGFLDLTGLPAQSRKLDLRDLDAMLHADDRAAVRIAAQRAAETGAFEADFRVVLPDGSIRWQHAQGRVELADGAPRRATGALIDISDERMLLVRLEAARLGAEASARAAQTAERLELDRKNVLELVATDQPLDQIAAAIALAVERHLPLACCSVQIDVPGAERISISVRMPEPLATVLARIPFGGVREPLTAAKVGGILRAADGERPAGASSDLQERSCLTASILQRTVVAGAIVALLPAGVSATAADRELLESWARVASLAIERREMYEQLSFRAQYDELTTLFNRASLYDRMDAQIARARRDGAGAMAVLYLDLDGFKQINDRHGHAAGDAALRAFARRILGSIRGGDVAARVGGDEFVILLPGVADRLDASRVADLIGRAVGEPIVFEGLELRVGSSAGIAVYPEDGRHTDVLLKIADADMYRVKLDRRCATGV